MVTPFALLYVCFLIVSGQVWEQEIQFTGKKIIRITMSSNLGDGTSRRQPSPPNSTLSSGNFSSDSMPADGATADKPPSPFSDVFYNSIQQSNSSWQPNRNFDDSLTEGFVSSLTGLHPDYLSHMPSLPKKYSHKNTSIPDEFDARKQWPDCATIQEIRDQGSCGSCWAISTAEAMSDRFCIHSNATQHFHFSVEDLISCCTTCGYGCDGGYPGEAWNYWKETGVVSGGDYESKDTERRNHLYVISTKGCRPYTVEPCDHHGKNSSRKACTQSVSTPKCTRSCVRGYNVTYQQDLHFGADAYSIETKVETIQLEILNNGPVVAAFEVYEDFLSYGEGVYQHVQGKKVGGHAIKIIGWGVDPASKLPYWLCANSWNVDWGKLGGFFKIKRGSNECNIEKDITAGMPKIKNT